MRCQGAITACDIVAAKNAVPAYVLVLLFFALWLDWLPSALAWSVVTIVAVDVNIDWSLGNVSGGCASVDRDSLVGFVASRLVS